MWDLRLEGGNPAGTCCHLCGGLWTFPLVEDCCWRGRNGKKCRRGRGVCLKWRIQPDLVVWAPVVPERDRPLQGLVHGVCGRTGWITLVTEILWKDYWWIANLYSTARRCTGTDFSGICVHMPVENIILSLQYPWMYFPCVSLSVLQCVSMVDNLHMEEKMMHFRKRL